MLEPTDSKAAVVRRILDRYLIEVVETYDLCPWARTARLGGELVIDILWGTPPIESWIASARALLAMPGARVAMVVAPELAASPAELRAIRDGVAPQVPTAGIAHFHPEASLDLGTPARTVPFLRRSPDPLLQLVPFAILDPVRAAVPNAKLRAQAQMLGGWSTAPREDVGDRIAAANHTRITADQTTVIAVLDAITEDRRVSYARAGIVRSPAPDPQ